MARQNPFAGELYMSTTETLHGGTLEILSPEETKARLDRNEIVLIDVRTPAEYAFERIDGALLFPLSSFDANKLPTQDGKAIVFHCGSGARSKRVAEACLAAGMGRIAHMDDGLMGWKSAQLPYIATDMATGAPVKIG
jgi:rhodanese-related sulfurtransferase